MRTDRLFVITIRGGKRLRDGILSKDEVEPVQIRLVRIGRRESHCSAQGVAQRSTLEQADPERVRNFNFLVARITHRDTTPRYSFYVV